MDKSKDLSDLVAMVAKMPIEKRERWMKRHGFTGMAAVALMQKVRRVWAVEAMATIKREMETPEFRAAFLTPIGGAK